MSADTPAVPSFRDLSLSPEVLSALDAVGYETPTPIQTEIIPHVLAGRDVVGQAQTGTGKTAAFALPLLSRVDVAKLTPQVLVLAPTRELAIQVAEAFQRYATHIKGFHVLPIYGGQDYRPQIRQLQRGVHVVVGTPGRVMDHMRRGTLDLGALATVVLDEADEMLRMGFIDDVNWILEQTPAARQVALFSATMPPAIRRIAQQHLKDPAEITIKVRTATAETIRQRYWMVSEPHKLDTLTRILEAEPFDGVIIFVRTKTATLDLAQKLEARGYACAALNGDIPQAQRERTVGQLKAGKLDILVATDVVARGLDVERVTHVINYDIPYDTEAYIHRIGRTGRAGRSGEAILFVSPREKRMLYAIERATRKQIDVLELPSTEAINDQRIARFKQRITDALGSEDISFFTQLVEQYQQEHNIPAVEIAAALASLLQGSTPLLLRNVPAPRGETRHPEDRSRERPRAGRERAPREERPHREYPTAEERPRREFAPREDRPRRDAAPERGGKIDRERPQRAARDKAETEAPTETFRIEVGHRHGVKPANIVGAIANEAGIESRYIGRIDIHDDYSTVDLPTGMPRELLLELQKVWVSGQQLRITRLNAAAKPKLKLAAPRDEQERPRRKPERAPSAKPGARSKPPRRS
jgi:ATP-dependent RNA helicase DeaD